jgi:thiol-disulfide isomerase/thioredoxin
MLSIDKRKFGICVVVFLLAFLVCVTVNAKPSSSRTAPEIKVREWMTDDPPDINNLKGRVYVVDFWATWCHSCVEGMEELNQINKKYSDRGLLFMSLCQDKSPEAIDKMIQEKNINFHVAIDHGTADWYEVKYYPTVAVVNHEGEITWQGKPWDKKFVKAIDKAMAAAPNQATQAQKYTKNTKK